MPRNPATSHVPASPPESFTRVTRSSTKPVYEPKPPQPHIDLELLEPDASLPDLSQVADFDPADLVASQPAPEIRFSVLAGVRARIAERRAAAVQSRLERLAEEQNVIRYAGERVLQGRGYTALSPGSYPDGMDRPHRLLEKGPAARLARIHKRRLGTSRAVMSRIEPYPDVRGKKQTFKPFFDQYDKGPGGHMKRSWGERRAMGVAARKYRNNERMGRLFYDRLFKHVATKPSRDAKGLPERRDRLVVKAAALRREAEKRKKK